LMVYIIFQQKQIQTSHNQTVKMFEPSCFSKAKQNMQEDHLSLS